MDVAGFLLNQDYMLYDSPESQKEEERFAQQLQKVRNMDKAAIENAVKNVRQMVPIFNELVKAPHRTVEEDNFVKNFPVMAQELATFLDEAKLILNESLTRQATAIYENVKQLAENGDEKAKKIYEDLKPLYQDALKDKLGTN